MIRTARLTPTGIVHSAYNPLSHRTCAETLITVPASPSGMVRAPADRDLPGRGAFPTRPDHGARTPTMTVGEQMARTLAASNEVRA